MNYNIEEMSYDITKGYACKLGLGLATLIGLDHLEKTGICWLWNDKIAKYKNGFTRPIIRNELWNRLVNKMSVGSVLDWRIPFRG